MEIEISGFKVLIDEEDYERVMTLSWYVHKNKLKKSGHQYFHHTYNTSAGTYDTMLHRFIVGCEYKDGIIVDHINGDTLDNRKSNLRKCTRAENNRNRATNRNSSTHLKGVSFHKLSGKYEAQISLNKKHIHLGLFSTPEEAHAAYCEASKKHHKEFGRVG